MGKSVLDKTLDVDEIPAINPYDHNGIKRTLDEQIPKLIKREFGFSEDHYWGNRKMALMILCGLIAAVVHLLPGETRDNYYAVLIGIISFFTLNSVLMGIAYLVEKNYIMTAHFDEHQYLKIKTEFPKHQEQIKIEFQLWQKESNTLNSTSSLEKSVGEYFSEKGELDLSPLRSDVSKLLSDLTKKHVKKNQ